MKFHYLPTEGIETKEQTQPKNKTFEISLSLLRKADVPGAQRGGGGLHLSHLLVGERCV